MLLNDGGVGLGGGDDSRLGGRHSNISHGNSDTGTGCETEAEFFDVIQRLSHDLITDQPFAFANQPADGGFIHRLIEERHHIRQRFIEDDAADAGLNLFTFRSTHFNLSPEINQIQVKVTLGLFIVTKALTLTFKPGAYRGQVVAAKDHVQAGGDHRIAGRGQ